MEHPKLLGLRSVIYPINDLEKSKKWWTEALGYQPYVDQPFYVGFKIGGYDVQLTAVKGAEGPNYQATVAEMRVTRGGALFTTQFPEKRFYPVQGMPTTEAAIHQSISGDLYLVIGDPQKDGGWAVRAYVKPFADWIWAGTLMMALGGLISLSDRRYRAAAGAKRSAAKGLPAE